ncbi:MAG: thioredoxin-dependent thiol peroxidase [Marinilabiliaceae bacterium]|nr:thioredoxin-dependent thiol peroxidase [Marinilabiliaceae bacterium]
MQIGDQIPAILGTDQNGKEIKSEDFRGKRLVLYTYPKDNTSGCTAEACSLRDHKEALAAKGYAILGVSKDSAASHLKFIEKQSLNFDLIADTETTLLQQLGAWGEKSMCGKVSMGTLRTTYLVDENGIITHIFTPKQIKTKEHAEQILAVI